MHKRFVEVILKETGNKHRFSTITKMYQKLGEDVIGITRNSMWNSIAKNDGVYENSKIRVEYKEVWRLGDDCEI